MRNLLTGCHESVRKGLTRARGEPVSITRLESYDRLDTVYALSNDGTLWTISPFYYSSGPPTWHMIPALPAP
jgi:hypothetical protein